ncbi:transmembrane protein 192 [Lycorma delicatula]|uniref:transmembrane protein 192 n=1 Tax=Lycorma delicatula TaxID=130591 RepID=UPI003F5182CC
MCCWDSLFYMPSSDLQTLIHPVTSNNHQYAKVPTIWTASLYLILCAIFELAGILVAVNWPSNATHCDPLYILLYSHVAFWFITLIVDHYFKWRHHLLYLKGYLEFSEVLKKLSAFPFLIVSTWNAGLLLMLTLYHQFFKEIEPACSSHDLRSPIIGGLLLFTLEIILIFICIIRYIYKVRMFNLENHLPDVHGSERMAPLHSFVSHEVGFREEVHGLEELLEKQADLIKFLKNENEVLNKKILTLNCQMRGEAIN